MITTKEIIVHIRPIKYSATDIIAFVPNEIEHH